ncbi:MAG: ribonuclease III [Anaerolineae bacterium]|nr:ribonuclease III [Anaerolineae bacterium]
MQERLGLRFHRPELLREALTHSSYVNENPCEATADNERLEFLGDAVFDLLAGEELYLRFPSAREGELTAMRAALVRTDTLARVSRSIDLASHLFLGRGEEASGGRYRAANLCAALEAVIGATYLDHGLGEARRLVHRFLKEVIDALGQTATRDPKSLLQERVQARLHCTPVYRTVAETGPDHAKQFLVEVLVGGRVVGAGRGSSKQAAEQAAARAALQNPEADVPETTSFGVQGSPNAQS